MEGEWSAYAACLSDMCVAAERGDRALLDAAADAAARCGPHAAEIETLSDGLRFARACAFTEARGGERGVRSPYPAPCHARNAGNMEVQRTADTRPDTHAQDLTLLMLICMSRGGSAGWTGVGDDWEAGWPGCLALCLRDAGHDEEWVRATAGFIEHPAYGHRLDGPGTALHAVSQNAGSSDRLLLNDARDAPQRAATIALLCHGADPKRSFGRLLGPPSARAAHSVISVLRFCEDSPREPPAAVAEYIYLATAEVLSGRGLDVFASLPAVRAVLPLPADEAAVAKARIHEAEAALRDACSSEAGAAALRLQTRKYAAEVALRDLHLSGAVSEASSLKKRLQDADAAAGVLRAEADAAREAGDPDPTRHDAEVAALRERASAAPEEVAAAEDEAKSAEAKVEELRDLVRESVSNASAAAGAAGGEQDALNDNVQEGLRDEIAALRHEMTELTKRVESQTRRSSVLRQARLKWLAGGAFVVVLLAARWWAASPAGP